MKRLISLLLLVLLQGCVTLYKPNSINSPLLSEQGDGNVSASLGVSGCGVANLQASVAVSDHFGLIANGMYHNSNTSKADSTKQNLNSIFGELGCGYFEHFHKDGIMQFFGGFGFGQTNGSVSGDGIPEPEIKAKYFNIFAQPGVALVKKNVAIGLDIRLNYVRFYSVSTYKYNHFEWWDADYGGNGISTCDFVVAEPTATLRAGSEHLKFQVQAGITIPVVNSNSYFDINTSSIWGLPMFKFSVGMCYSFGNAEKED